MPYCARLTLALFQDILASYKVNPVPPSHSKLRSALRSSFKEHRSYSTKMKRMHTWDFSLEEFKSNYAEAERAGSLPPHRSSFPLLTPLAGELIEA
mmetsp:Transcript_34961/g.53616  ORF Transcript_34961/g.53616 Transcript_34961/m.53616 type:complete len:96 (+) Transcript_34961:199-486(+)